jgi:predicted dehydrogenase
MSQIKCAVIGVGYLGRFHAQKYKLIPEANLIAVCDVNQDACNAVAQELNVQAYTDYKELFGKVDAVSIAATTKFHYAIARECLKQGIHVLIEKPITETLEQAAELISIAKDRNVVLQVGHLERFNAARLALEPHLNQPLFIESQRLAPYNPRGADVNVILDLMIHDIDLLQTMVNSPIISIDAHGAPILSSGIDIANARITFENHCVANVTASRVSFKSERKMRIFQRNCYISIDYQNKQFAVFAKGTGEMFPGIPNVMQHQENVAAGDALLEEIKSFVSCIQNQQTPLVTGQDGYNALATATRITTLINNNLTTLNAYA